MLGTKRKKSHKKILNKSGLRIDHCETPNGISLQDLKELFILPLCPLFVKKECRHLKDGMSNTYA